MIALREHTCVTLPLETLYAQLLASPHSTMVKLAAEQQLQLKFTLLENKSPIKSRFFGFSKFAPLPAGASGSRSG